MPEDGSVPKLSDGVELWVDGGGDIALQYLVVGGMNSKCSAG